MQLETVNKLYLELSQVATAKTARELELEELLRSAHNIALRKGEDTAWDRFASSIAEKGIGAVTARVYTVLPHEEQLAPHQQRVVEEKNELDKKAKALSQFIGLSPVFETLGAAEQERLKVQNEIMWQYSEILGRRIAAF